MDTCLFLIILLKIYLVMQTLSLGFNTNCRWWRYRKPAAMSLV